MVNIQNIIGNNLLLFTINIWIKKLRGVNIQNIFLGITCPYPLINKSRETYER